MNRYMRNHEKRNKLNEDRVARAAGGASSSGGIEADAVVSASPSLAAALSQRELRPRRARTDAHQMDVDESYGNDTEEDEPYRMNPREGSDDESEKMTWLRMREMVMVTVRIVQMRVKLATQTWRVL